MVLYNTLMGVVAGLALILVPVLGRKLLRREPVAPEGWAMVLGVLGLILTFLSGAMAVTWPLTVNPPINIVFAEPNLVLGVLLLAAALFLWQRREFVRSLSDKHHKTADESHEYLLRVLAPVSWLLGGLGLVLLACALAIWRFNLVGSAPEIEPITGLLNAYPVIENTFFALLYGLSALGTLLAPFALRRLDGPLPKVVGWSLVIAGVTFLLFSAMNYYTHVGLLVNLQTGSNYEF